MTPSRRRWSGLKLGLVLAVLLGAGAWAPAQEAPRAPQAPRARDLLKTAVDSYKRGEFEAAAVLFTQAQLGRNDLEASERTDLDTFSTQNQHALKARLDGSAQVRQATDAVNQGRPADAARLLKGLQANPYLTAADRQARDNLATRVSSGRPSQPTTPNVPADGKAYLNAARNAYQQGDLDTAEMFAAKAEKAGLGGSWMQPWADSPAKVRRDVQAARAKQGGPVATNGSADMAGGPAMVPPLTQGAAMPQSPYNSQSPPAARPQSPYNSQSPQAAMLPDAARAPVPQTAPPSGDKRMLARQMLAEGYNALRAGDLEQARLMAFRVRDLNVDLGRNEMGPEQLLQEIQNRATAIAANNTRNQPLPTDSRALLKEGRSLLQQHRLEEAAKVCVMANSVPNARWGLFEDTPEKLKGDILRARAQRNRDDADRMLVEARKQFAQGNLDDAKSLAQKAQELHGAYSPFDFGDRPQRLLSEIEVARTDKSRPQAPPQGNTVARNDGGARVPDPTRPLPSAPDSPKAQASALIAQARELERRGLLVEAQQKAVEAKKLGVVFTPGEDSPDAVMLSLFARCKNHIQSTLLQVTDSVASRPGDAARLQKANVDLAGARQLAMQFGLDTHAIDQKVAWVQQAANPGTGVTNPIVQAGNQAPTGQAPTGQAPIAPAPAAQASAAQASPADAKHKEGLEKLELARRELSKGNCATARKLAEDSFDAHYGVQKEATAVLRDIDAEEHNQRLLAMQRTFDSGVEAYVHGQFKHALAILSSVDVALLAPHHQQRMREIMSTREMQALPQAGDNKVILTQGTLEKGAPGAVVASEQGDDALGQVKALEAVQFQQVYQRNSQAMKSALELFKTGQKMKAVDVLTGQINHIEMAGLSAEAIKQLRSPVDKRLSEFRTMMAQELVENQRKALDKALVHDEGAYQEKVRKQQEQVADLIKQCQALSREQKYKDCLALAYKAHELDPDNQAATAYITMCNIQTNLQVDRQDRTNNEGNFLEALRWNEGRVPTDDNPFQMPKNAIDRLTGRKDTLPYIQMQKKNPKERAIEYRLEQPIQFGFKDTALREVINTLSALSGVPVYPDEDALKQANIDMDQRLTMDSNGLSMRSALNILLGKMRLTYVTKHESLMITTADKATGNMQLKVYPVGDLIIPVDNHPVPDVFNFTKVLEKHMASQYAMLNYVGASPLNNQQMGLPPAPPVSNYQSGLGSAFGASSPGQSPQTSPGYAGVQRPRAPGETMEQLLMDLIQGTIQPHTWKNMGGPGTIQFYPLGMALAINQNQEVQGDVEDLLRALRRLQDMEIAIEMRVVLVAESFYERIGVDFSLNLKTLEPSTSVQNQILSSSFQPFGTINRNLGFSRALLGLTPAGTLTPDLNVPVKPSSFNFSVPPFGGYTAPGLDGGLSLGLAFLSDIQVFMILEAAQADSRTNIMMAPKITVFNGQTATLTVSVTQFLNLGITAVPINGQIIFIPSNVGVPIGTALTVLPVVSADRRFVRLNLAPNISSLGGGVGGLINGNTIPVSQVQIPVPNVVEGPLGLGIPTGQPSVFNTFILTPSVSNIILNTTVNVPDGGTVLLGGIKVMSEGRNEAGPPILSKIPYLDRLFRNVGWGRDGQSLMIMVTPRIIINEEEEAIYTGQMAPIPRP
jgi:type II secretory pathway component GspD/PulD (secretin)